MLSWFVRLCSIWASPSKLGSGLRCSGRYAVTIFLIASMGTISVSPVLSFVAMLDDSDGGDGVKLLDELDGVAFIERISSNRLLLILSSSASSSASILSCSETGSSGITNALLGPVIGEFGASWFAAFSGVLVVSTPEGTSYFFFHYAVKLPFLASS